MEEPPAATASIGAPLIRRIAYPVDFAHCSENGVSWAIHFAQQHDADLHLLHVIPPPTPLFEPQSPIKFEAELALALLLGKLKTAEIKARGFLLSGSASTDAQIVRAAKLERVDLIIMEANRPAILSRLFGRGVASGIIACAHCPVLVVPYDATAKVIVRTVGKPNQNVS